MHRANGGGANSFLKIRQDMSCGGIGISPRAVAVLCDCSMQKDRTKEENIQLKILAKIDMLRDINGLHIEDSQRISSTQRCLEDEITMDEKRNHDANAIQMSIAFHSKGLKQYQVRVHPDTDESGRIDAVLQLKNDVLHVHTANVDNAYEKVQETPATSKDKENFLPSLLSQKYRKEAKDYFRYQKQEQDATTVYTVELTNNEKFSECINKTGNEREDIHFEELKLSYITDGKTVLKTDTKQHYRTSQDIREQEYNRLLTEITLRKTRRTATSEQSSEFLELK